MIAQTYYMDSRGRIETYDDWKDDARCDGWNLHEEIQGGELIEVEVIGITDGEHEYLIVN